MSDEDSRDSGSVDEPTAIGEDQLDDILKDPRMKAALLKKMGLDEPETNANQRSTLSGTNPGVPSP